jgi:predicted CoA-binding protein
MANDYPDDDLIREILSGTRTIAVVGASPNPLRPSNGVLRFLVQAGYEVYPVNPGHAGKEIGGRTVHARLSDVPVPIDMVDVFRRSEAVGGVVDEVLRLEPLPRYIWMQLGVVDEAAAARAEAKGVKVIMDRCPAIEYPRLFGRVRRPLATA